MAKRNALAFPDNAGPEPKGRREILRSRDEIAADEEILESQASGDPASQLRDTKPDRTQFQKVTYRISPDAADAIYEARRALRREHGIKASLEEIAEAAILTAFQDLVEKEQESNLVYRLSGDPGSQNSG